MDSSSIKNLGEVPAQFGTQGTLAPVNAETFSRPHTIRRVMGSTRPSFIESTGQNTSLPTEIVQDVLNLPSEIGNIEDTLANKSSETAKFIEDDLGQLVSDVEKIPSAVSGVAKTAGQLWHDATQGIQNAVDKIESNRLQPSLLQSDEKTSIPKRGRKERDYNTYRGYSQPKVIRSGTHVRASQPLEHRDVDRAKEVRDLSEQFEAMLAERRKENEPIEDEEKAIEIKDDNKELTAQIDDYSRLMENFESIPSVILDSLGEDSAGVKSIIRPNNEKLTRDDILRENRLKSKIKASPKLQKSLIDAVESGLIYEGAPAAVSAYLFSPSVSLPKRARRILAQRLYRPLGTIPSGLRGGSSSFEIFLHDDEVDDWYDGWTVADLLIEFDWPLNARWFCDGFLVSLEDPVRPGRYKIEGLRGGVDPEKKKAKCRRKNRNRRLRSRALKNIVFSYPTDFRTRRRTASDEKELETKTPLDIPGSFKVTACIGDDFLPAISWNPSDAELKDMPESSFYATEELGDRLDYELFQNDITPYSYNQSNYFNDRLALHCHADGTLAELPDSPFDRYKDDSPGDVWKDTWKPELHSSFKGLTSFYVHPEEIWDFEKFTSFMQRHCLHGTWLFNGKRFNQDRWMRSGRYSMVGLSGGMDEEKEKEVKEKESISTSETQKPIRVQKDYGFGSKVSDLSARNFNLRLQQFSENENFNVWINSMIKQGVMSWSNNDYAYLDPVPIFNVNVKSIADLAGTPVVATSPRYEQVACVSDLGRGFPMSFSIAYSELAGQIASGASINYLRNYFNNPTASLDGNATYNATRLARANLGQHDSTSFSSVLAKLFLYANLYTAPKVVTAAKAAGDNVILSAPAVVTGTPDFTVGRGITVTTSPAKVVTFDQYLQICVNESDPSWKAWSPVTDTYLVPVSLEKELSADNLAIWSLLWLPAPFDDVTYQFTANTLDGTALGAADFYPAWRLFHGGTSATMNILFVICDRSSLSGTPYSINVGGVTLTTPATVATAAGLGTDVQAAWLAAQASMSTSNEWYFQCFAWLNEIIPNNDEWLNGFMLAVNASMRMRWGNCGKRGQDALISEYWAKVPGSNNPFITYTVISTTAAFLQRLNYATVTVGGLLQKTGMYAPHIPKTTTVLLFSSIITYSDKSVVSSAFCSPKSVLMNMFTVGLELGGRVCANFARSKLDPRLFQGYSAMTVKDTAPIRKFWGMICDKAAAAMTPGWFDMGVRIEWSRNLDTFGLTWNQKDSEYRLSGNNFMHLAWYEEYLPEAPLNSVISYNPMKEIMSVSDYNGSVLHVLISRNRLTSSSLHKLIKLNTVWHADLRMFPFEGAKTTFNYCPAMPFSCMDHRPYNNLTGGPVLSTVFTGVVPMMCNLYTEHYQNYLWFAACWLNGSPSRTLEPKNGYYLETQDNAVETVYSDANITGASTAQSILDSISG